VSATYLLNRGPNSLRKKMVLGGAITILVECNLLVDARAGRLCMGKVTKQSWKVNHGHSNPHTSAAVTAFCKSPYPHCSAPEASVTGNSCKQSIVDTANLAPTEKSNRQFPACRPSRSCSRSQAWRTSEANQILEHAIETGRGSVYLRLTPVHYARLKKALNLAGVVGQIGSPSLPLQIPYNFKSHSLLQSPST
jgi:hypothetical protein